MSFLIKNAFVIDGTGKPGRTGNVLIEGDRIKDTGPHLQATPGSEVIDGEGLTLCPGFIDAHSHSDISILAAPEAYGKISQGVTTEIAGNCGLSAFPVNRNNREHLQELYRNYGVEITWSSFRRDHCRVHLLRCQRLSTLAPVLPILAPFSCRQCTVQRKLAVRGKPPACDATKPAIAPRYP